MIRGKPQFLAPALALGLFACATLKNGTAGDVDNDGMPDADGGRGSSFPGTGSSDPDDGTVTHTSSSDAGGGSSGKPIDPTGGNGDPRWPQGPVAADAPAASSYTITNGADGAIVTDKATGLSWQDAVRGPFNFEKVSAHCDALVYSGFSDWRAPTRTEAVAIMSFGDYSKTTFTSRVFSTGNEDCLWTGSKYAGSRPNGTQQAWSISPRSVDVAMTDLSCEIRCVRGGPAVAAPVPKQYVLDADTVTDPVTRLVWERTPPDTETSFEAAKERCEGLTLGGHKMRLPTIKELLSIADETKYMPALSSVFGGPRDVIFTSNEHWVVKFDVGRTFETYTVYPQRSRCVASLP